MIPSFRPAHDRVPLTVRERRALARMEREFDVDGQTTVPLPSPAALLRAGLLTLVVGAVAASGVVLAAGAGLALVALGLAAVAPRGAGR